MRLLGLVGGTTWISTQEYYTHLNQLTNKRLAGSESAKLVLWSLNFGDVLRNIERGDQAANGGLALEACLKLQDAGAEAILLCANTFHMFCDDIQPKLNIPIIHLVDAVAEEARQLRLTKLLLLGTKFTMEHGFFQARMEGSGIELLVPNDEDRGYIHHNILHDLSRNIFDDPTREAYLRIIGRGIEHGIDAVILGCTELPVLFEGVLLPVPAIDTTLVHARAGVDFMLGV